MFTNRFGTRLGTPGAKETDRRLSCDFIIVSAEIIFEVPLESPTGDPIRLLGYSI